MGCIKLEHIERGYLKKIVFSSGSAVERSGNASKKRLKTYRFAYNGMEADGEVSGNGNSYTTQFRQYDPRLGRWKSLDPLKGKYPWMSPYVAFNNNPAVYIDPLGLEGKPGKSKYESGTTRNGGFCDGCKPKRREYNEKAGGFSPSEFESKLPKTAPDNDQYVINYPDEERKGYSRSITYTFDENSGVWNREEDIIGMGVRRTTVEGAVEDYIVLMDYMGKPDGEFSISGNGGIGVEQKPIVTDWGKKTDPKKDGSVPASGITGSEITENSPTPDNVVDEPDDTDNNDDTGNTDTEVSSEGDSGEIFAAITLATLILENAVPVSDVTKGFLAGLKVFSKANGALGALTNGADVVSDIVEGTVDAHTVANGVEATAYAVGTGLLFSPFAPVGGAVLIVTAVVDLVHWIIWQE